MPVNTAITIRKGTASQWSSTNPVLASGEPGYDLSNNILKIGDGVSNWNSLSNHKHSSIDITNFNSSVSGVLDSSLSTSLVGGTGIFINYISANDTLVINASGLQPSGNYSVVGHSHTSSDIVNFNTSVSGLVSGIYAPLNSPALTGIPTVPTANSGTNNNQAASTAFVRTEISNLVSSAPSTLDTLNELATALGNDANFSTTVTNTLAGKANLNGATFTGAISGPSGNFTQSLLVNGTAVSVSGHTHLSSNITDFNSSVSGILPVKNITAGSGISINNNSGIYTINSTATGSSSTSVIEYNNVSNFPSSGVGSTIYISTDTGRIYRWASSVYQELGPVSYAPIGSDSRWDLFLPPAPTGLAVTPGNTQVTLAWNAPTVSIQTPITDYTVQYSADSGSSWTTFTRSISTSTTVSVTGLTNGQGYIFRVAAVNGIGTGAYSTVSRAVAPFNPPSVTGLQLWLDSSDASTLFDATTGGSLVAADGSVARWQDKSGNGRHFTNDSSPPTLQTSGQNGLPVVAFDSALSQYLSCATLAVTGSSNRTVFVAGRATGTTSTSFYFALSDNVTDAGSAWGIANELSIRHSGGRFSVFGSGQSSVFNVVTAMQSGTTSSDTSMWRNSVSLTASSRNNPGAINTTGTAMTIAATNGTTATGITTCAIGEIIVYNSALSDANRSAVESYLISKWNIV
jgi:hypothetical protein